MRLRHFRIVLLPLSLVLVAKKHMKLLQLLSLAILVIAACLTYWVLTPITPGSSEASAGAAGLFLLFIAFPLFCCSALISVPTSIALLNSKLRASANFLGWQWGVVWLLNAICSIFYVGLALYAAYIFIETLGN